MPRLILLILPLSPNKEKDKTLYEQVSIKHTKI